MFKIFRKLSLFLKIFSYLRHLFPLLENGFYSIKRTGKIYLITKTKLSPFFVFSMTKESHTFINCVLHITYFQNKFLFKIGEHLYSFYDKKSQWKKYFDNMEKFTSQINYPVNDFNLCRKWRMKDELFVESETDLDYRDKLLFILDLAINADKIERDSLEYDFLREESNVIFYCQHGDAHIKNILKSNGKYVFIDLDDIEVYPALFDFFRLSIGDKKSLKEFINGSYDFEVCQVIGIEYNSDLIKQKKDLYFSLFILYFPDDISGLLDDIPLDYRLTRKAFEYKRNEIK